MCKQAGLCVPSYVLNKNKRYNLLYEHDIKTHVRMHVHSDRILVICENISYLWY